METCSKLMFTNGKKVVSKYTYDFIQIFIFVKHIFGLVYYLSELTILVVIGTDCTDSCKSNYHMITTMTAPTPDIKWTIPDSR
jgi:hypothetical protein